MAKIIIIGAGLTGLSAAYHLEQAGYTNFEIFEKEDQIGGLCRSIEQDGFTFDYTGHLLHISNNDFEAVINKYINKESLNLIHRRSFIYSHETYTDYPFQTNLFGLPSEVITSCIVGFINRPSKLKNHSFYNWVLYKFGTGLAKYFFIPYQTKIFDYDIRKVTASWTGRFVPETSLEQIIRGAIGAKQEGIGYNSEFFYPKHGGIFNWICKFGNQIKTKVNTNHCVKKIDFKNKQIYFTNDHVKKYNYLITTMPLDVLLKLAQEPSHQNLKFAANKLVCNSVINFNLGLKHNNISDKHWIYFPEKKYPFYRLGFYHNFSRQMAPANCSSIYGEFSYINKTKAHVDTLLKKSLQATQELLDFNASDIITKKIINIPHAYVIYNLWREQNLPKIHKSLNLSNIYSCGRYGEWKYSSMQEAFLDGKKVTSDILKRINFGIRNSTDLS